MRILLVEDEKALSKYIVKGLTNSGYAVDAVYNGEDALFEYSCQRQSKIVRKRRTNFVIFGDEGVTKIRYFLAQKECSRFAVSGA